MTAVAEQTDRYDFRKVAGTLGFAGISASGANIVMQLAMPGVGHGVARSTVKSGQLFEHPFKRARTTFTYLAVALLGTEDEQNAYREAVNGAHRPVHSEPGAEVKYNAFDPALQLWVAACIYRGLEDNMRWLDPTTFERDREAMYQSSGVIGSALQMKPEMWPADIEAFDAYWDETVRTQLHIDELVHDYLHEFLHLRFFPWPVPQVLGRYHRWVSTGWLAPEFRELMGLTWTERDQKRWTFIHRWVRRINALQPKFIRRLGFTIYLHDFRLRRRFGLRLV